jgi:23S rRNA (cytidine1920-2'-O)/16S rRNA (cytidine1409-2'-O)-methyltransferase
LIDNNSVKVNGVIVSKASYDIKDNDNIEVFDSIGYVGRGGLKLEEAIKTFNIDISGKEALDIGASTGGFTQCLLKYGAKSVVAVDVGCGQMHKSLIDDERVTLIEKFNAKDLNPELINGKKHIAVMDVSFISQTEIYSAMFSCLNEDGIAITLVKPQFEVGGKFLNKKGIVKDKKIYKDVFLKMQYNANKYGYSVWNICDSPILGGDGNKEFLFEIRRGQSDFDILCERALKG